MKKLALTCFIFFLTIVQVFAYTPYLQKGSQIMVYTKIPLSTANLEEGSRVYFIAPQDYWLLEKKAIEKGDIFYGYVSMLKMPVVGVNAAMKIDIDKLIKKNGEKKQLKAHLLFPGGEVLGGNLTNPASYNTTIHPQRTYGNYWGGTLQYVPSGEYEHGDHVKIDSRDILFVVLDEDYYI